MARYLDCEELIVSIRPRLWGRGKRSAPVILLSFPKVSIRPRLWGRGKL